MPRFSGSCAQHEQTAWHPVQLLMLSALATGGSSLPASSTSSIAAGARCPQGAAVVLRVLLHAQTHKAEVAGQGAGEAAHRQRGNAMSRRRVEHTLAIISPNLLPAPASGLQAGWSGNEAQVRRPPPRRQTGSYDLTAWTYLAGGVAEPDSPR